ncbi:MAG: DUF1003 domain-containing protein [Euzebyaceae bacterium]|nr:DUF1003 domain-containing protein [Euzebyaceae bacterium]
MSRRPSDLTRPRGGTRFGVHYDPDAFGRFSEAIAQFLGTARYLVAQTIVVIVWIIVNVVAVRLRWDPYPFILLNLFFSTQASYAAPLILLAQNRQAERDRAQVEGDREVTARTLADTEFLAREITSVRLAVAQLVTERDLTRELGRLTTELEALRAEVAQVAQPEQPTEPTTSSEHQE